jgi:hypothetical protein
LSERWLSIHLLHIDIIKSPVDIELGEVLGPLEFVDEFGDEEKWVLVLHSDCIQCSVILHSQSEPSFFLMKKTGDAIGDLEGQIHPVFRFSFKKASNSFCSDGDSR